MRKKGKREKERKGEHTTKKQITIFLLEFLAFLEFLGFLEFSKLKFWGDQNFDNLNIHP